MKDENKPYGPFQCTAHMPGCGVYWGPCGCPDCRAAKALSEIYQEQSVYLHPYLFNFHNLKEKR